MIFSCTKRVGILLFSLLVVFSLTPWTPRGLAQGLDEPAPAGGSFPNAEVASRVFLPVLTTRPLVTAAQWLNNLNAYRALAGLPPLTENPDWSYGGQAHSRYTVKNDSLGHDEDVNNPWYTPEGKAAAQSSNLMASSSPSTSDRHAMDAWMQAPFHAVSILDPSLHQVGYGSYRETDGGLQMGAALDVLRGQGDIPAEVHFPIFWPGNGSTSPLTSFNSESPNPLTSCPGYSAPSGLPVILQVGAGDLTPRVEAYSFSNDGVQLESCAFSETSYSNPDSSLQSLGRSILDGRDAVVLIPRQPLGVGEKYTVSIKVNGQTYTWSFNVGSADQLQTVSAETRVD
jgi:hypothetical protein